MGCNFNLDAAFIQPISGRYLKCRLVESFSENIPAVVEIINFDEVTTSKKVHVKVAKILNPAFDNTIAVIEFSVNIFVRDPVIGSIAYKFYDIYRSRIEIQSITLASDVVIPYATTSNELRF